MSGTNARLEKWQCYTWSRASETHSKLSDWWLDYFFRGSSIIFELHHNLKYVRLHLYSTTWHPHCRDAHNRDIIVACARTQIIRPLGLFVQSAHFGKHPVFMFWNEETRLSNLARPFEHRYIFRMPCSESLCDNIIKVDHRHEVILLKLFQTRQKLHLLSLENWAAYYMLECNNGDVDCRVVRCWLLTFDHGSRVRRGFSAPAH